MKNGFTTFRLKVGLKQGEAAQQLGVSQTTVSMWECGQSLPRGATLLKVAALYCCSIDELLQQVEK